MNEATGNLDPVVGGACLSIKNASWDTFCTPDCDGRECGSDGCGGTCGSGCLEDLSCSAQGQCVPFECAKVSVSDFNVSEIDKPLYLIDYTPNSGDTQLDDILSMTLGTKEFGSEVLLNSELNSNYSTCTHCLLLKEDIDKDGLAGKYYFQQSGKILISDAKTDFEGSVTGESAGTLKDVRLVEVKMNFSSHVTTPVLGGSCIEIADSSWNTFCTPNCNGKECGSDGCGGFCGSCVEGKTCSDSGTCEDFSCAKITLDELKQHSEVPEYYYSTYTPATGGAESDEFYLQFWRTQAAGTYELNSEKNSNTKTCDQCFLVYEDLNGNFMAQTIFFQESGKIVIEETDSTGAVSKGYFENVRLVETEINPSGYTSTPVPNGRCLEISSGNWDSTQQVQMLQTKNLMLER